jgi:protein-tyrosine phosphatase
MDTIRILFVCHGNKCRSAMAEFILKALVKARGPEGFRSERALRKTGAFFLFVFFAIFAAI